MKHPIADLLIADDNPSDAELIQECLELPASITVRVARDGVEALDYLFCRGEFSERGFGHPPRLVLLDIKLPRVDGLEVLRQLRADDRTRAIPVVMLTSSRLEQDVMRAYTLGASSYVQKPMAFVQFREAVRAVGRYWLEINEPPPASAHRPAAKVAPSER